MIRTVFFDAAGTLLEVAEPVGETYARFARRAGRSVEAAALEKGFRGAFAAAPPLAFPGAAADELRSRERNWWRLLVADAFTRAGCTLPAEVLEAVFGGVFAHFAQADAWRLFPEVPRTLAGLRERGLKLAVVSNFDARLRGLLQCLGIAPRFDAVVVSSECGYAKPAPEIFAAALRVTGARPHATLHVGDSEALDVRGARAAGLSALHLDRGSVSGADKITISSLAEIVDHIA